MTKPVAIANCNYIDGRAWPEPQTRITARRDGGFTFYAPGWRRMAFKTIEAAKAKMERHPGFQGWAA